MRRNIGLWGLLALFLAAAPALADTLRVPGDYATIQAAVDAASDGDVIKVGKDVYPEAVVIDGFEDLTLSGSRATIDGGGVRTPITVRNSTGVTISGFVLPDSDAEGIYVADSEDVAVTKCTVTGSAGHGIAAVDCVRVAVEKCTIEDPGTDGVHIVEGQGGICEQCSVVGNRIMGTGDDGIAMTGSEHRIEKNRLVDCGDDGISTFKDYTLDDCTIAKNTIDGAPDNGIVLDGNRNRIEKNRISDVGDGMELAGDDHVVEKNRISGCANDGISVYCTNSRIAKNRISDVEEEDVNGEDGGAGIDVYESGNTIEGNRIAGTSYVGIDLDYSTTNSVLRNRISNTGHEGITADGYESLIEGNKVKNAGSLDLDDGNGIRCDGDDNTFRANKVSVTRDDGFDITGTGNLLEDNKATKAGDDGFDLDTGGNTLFRNKASGNAEYDLDDSTGEGGNAYGDGRDANKFKKINIWLDVP